MDIIDGSKSFVPHLQQHWDVMMSVCRRKYSHWKNRKKKLHFAPFLQVFGKKVRLDWNFEFLQVSCYIVWFYKLWIIAWLQSSHEIEFKVPLFSTRLLNLTPEKKTILTRLAKLPQHQTTFSFSSTRLLMPHFNQADKAAAT